MRTPVDPSPEGAGVSLTPWWLTTPCPTTGPSTTSTDGSTVWSVDSPGGATHEEHSPRPTHGSSRGHRGCHRRSRALLRGEFVFRSLTYHRAIHLPQQSMLRLGFRVTPPLGGGDVRSPRCRYAQAEDPEALHSTSFRNSPRAR